MTGNRWVKLSKVVPWGSFATIYMSVMNSEIGRPGLSPRMVLGALIIKHLEKLDDRSVISNIQENIYMQYFVGLKGFCPNPIFDASLFVELRKRIGASTFDKLNSDLIKSISKSKDEKQHSKRTKTIIQAYHQTKGIYKWMQLLPTSILPIQLMPRF